MSTGFNWMDSDAWHAPIPSALLLEGVNESWNCGVAIYAERRPPLKTARSASARKRRARTQRYATPIMRTLVWRLSEKFA